MIRCTIELLPGGDETRKRTIGLVEIVNIAGDAGDYGDYAVVLKKTPPFAGALRAAWRAGKFRLDPRGFATSDGAGYEGDYGQVA